MKKVLLIIAFLAGTFFVSFSQNERKFSVGTRLVIAKRIGKMKTDDKVNLTFKGAPVTPPRVTSVPRSVSSPFGTHVKTTSERRIDNKATFATPKMVKGVKKIQAWVTLTDKDYYKLRELGVVIQAEFDGFIVANIPVNALEKVAALDNVKRISTAKNLQENTYYARQATNVDDVLDYTADAQAAGLLQAYDGTGVVIGIIDTGIQFDHIMFKDENGNTRIKKAIVYDSDSEQLVEYDTPSAISALTYDTDATYHGTHTSSIAGGSIFSFSGYYYDNSTSSYVNGTRVYGGMAPKADLVLCGLGDETTNANIAMCIQRISQYADQVGKPCVISISLGSMAGPHDGTGYLSEVCEQYMSGPGKILVKAAGNDGDENVYLYKNATKANPAMTILNPTYLDGYESGNYTLNNYFLYGQAITYARTPGVELAARFYVVDTSTNTIVWVSDEMTSDTQWSVNSGETDTDATYDANLAQYFSAATDGGGYLCAFFDTDEYSGKANIYTNVYYLTAESYTQSGYTLTGKYKIGLSCYPKDSGVTTAIDSWGLNYTYFDGGNPTYNGTTYSFVAGNSLCSIGDECTSPYVIPIGSYTTMTSWAASNGSGYTATSTTLNDVALSSGYQDIGAGPLGTKLPWITAPGQMIVAAFNRGWVANNSSSTYLLYQYNSTNPLGVASGTSMASPCAGGIVALWLQADPTLTIDDVKNVMRYTAINDSYTNGTNADHFGNGKIDALAGIKYILNTAPTIYASPSELAFNLEEITTTAETITISGQNLQGDITVTLTDANGVYSIDKTSITATEAQTNDGVMLTVSFNPADYGTFNGTITLSSTGADDVTILISGTAKRVGTASDAYLDIANYATIDDAGWRTALVNNIYKYTEYETAGVAWLTLPVYGAFVGARYTTNSSTVGSGHPQQWIECNLGTSNTYGGTTWTYTATSMNPYNGSSTYFTSATARAIGYNSRTNTSIRDVSFYVTNTTEVKLYGTGRSGASSSYPARLRIYECTKNADGTLTTGTTAVVNQTSSSTSTFNLTSGTLDASKIYKVETSIYRGYLYEIGFKTPLPPPSTAVITATPTTVNLETWTGNTVTETFNVKGTDLQGDITATLTDANGVFSISPTTITQAEAESSDGKNITVSFSPTTDGDYTATVTLTSTGADPVTVTLNGTAFTPTITAEPTTLEFETEYDMDTNTAEPISLTFDVLGEYLQNDVTLTLTDENGVLSTDPQGSISLTDAEGGVSVIVTFSPSAIGDYTGTITLSSYPANDVIINLIGHCVKKTPDFWDLEIGQYQMATLYLEFPVVVPNDANLLAVGYGKEVSNGEVRLGKIKIGNVIPAQTGVVVTGNPGTITFEKYKGDPVDPIEGNLFLGSLVDISVSDVLEDQAEGSVVMTLGVSNGTVGFFKYRGATLGANKIYMIYTPNGEAKPMSIVYEDEEMGLPTAIRTFDGTFRDGWWYTLQGVRLNGWPTKPGLYIHDGRIEVVK